MPSAVKVVRDALAADKRYILNGTNCIYDAMK